MSAQVGFRLLRLLLVLFVLIHPAWKGGKKNINILVLAVVYKGMAIPVYWLLLKS